MSNAQRKRLLETVTARLSRPDAARLLVELTVLEPATVMLAIDRLLGKVR
jgi:hypothetical protein